MVDKHGQRRIACEARSPMIPGTTFKRKKEAQLFFILTSTVECLSDALSNETVYSGALFSVSQYVILHF